MNRSLVLVTIAAALGLAACTSTPDTNTSTPSSTTTPPAQVVTEVVTQTVTNPPAPPTKPVIGSFGYGNLKLGMTGQQAIDAKLIGPVSGPGGSCSSHQIIGTDQYVWVSSKLGVASISFTADMTADGAGIGATEATLKAEYTNLKPTGPNYSWVAEADDNPSAKFIFGVNKETKKVVAAILSLHDQDCHN
ncbi:hypothetical protein ACIA8G_34695 [Lentzea sp. NPDC051213]|uniref:hypothetical protein n=1 Tax=Lentzea sp. NPDC051213 TaxID=3364126 RepID=UPI0037AC95D2